MKPNDRKNRIATTAKTIQPAPAGVGGDSTRAGYTGMTRSDATMPTFVGLSALGSLISPALKDERHPRLS